MAFPLIRLGEETKWQCRYAECSGYQFDTELDFRLHSVSEHKQDLPSDGFFLLPEKNYYDIGGIKCVECGQKFGGIQTIDKTTKAQLVQQILSCLRGN